MSRWGGRSRGACPATAGCLRASAGQGCGPHGSKEPRCTGNCSKNHCSAPSAAFLQAIAIRACCGLPLQRDGSPERHRCARLLLEFVELCRWQSQCWRHGFHRCARCPLGLSEPGVSPFRALRPSICAEVAIVGNSCRRCRPFMADGGPFFGDNFSVCRFFPIFVVPSRKAGKCGKI